MPSAVALLNYISSGILWRIFCQTGIFAGLSLHIINFAVRISEAGNRFLGPINVYKYGLWSQWDIKLPMYRWFWKFGRLFFVFGQITLWAIFGDILRGPRLFWPLNYPSLRLGQFRGQKGLGPLKKSLELSHYEFCPLKKNNLPHFPNQRYINS